MVETLGQGEQRFSSYLDDVEGILFNVHSNDKIHQILESTKQQDSVSSMNDVNTLESQLLSADPFKRKTSNVILYARNKDLYPGLNSGGYPAVYSSRDFESQQWYKETLEKNGGIYWQFVNGSYIS